MCLESGRKFQFFVFLPTVFFALVNPANLRAEDDYFSKKRDTSFAIIDAQQDRQQLEAESRMLEKQRKEAQKEVLRLKERARRFKGQDFSWSEQFQVECHDSCMPSSYDSTSHRCSERDFERAGFSGALERENPFSRSGACVALYEKAFNNLNGTLSASCATAVRNCGYVDYQIKINSYQEDIAAIDTRMGDEIPEERSEIMMELARLERACTGNCREKLQNRLLGRETDEGGSSTWDKIRQVLGIAAGVGASVLDYSVGQANWHGLRGMYRDYLGNCGTVGLPCSGPGMAFNTGNNYPNRYNNGLPGQYPSSVPNQPVYRNGPSWTTAGNQGPTSMPTGLRPGYSNNPIFANRGYSPQYPSQYPGAQYPSVYQPSGLPQFSLPQFSWNIGPNRNSVYGPSYPNPGYPNYRPGANLSYNLNYGPGNYGPSYDMQLQRLQQEQQALANQMRAREMELARLAQIQQQQQMQARMEYENQARRVAAANAARNRLLSIEAELQMARAQYEQLASPMYSYNNTGYNINLNASGNPLSNVLASLSGGGQMGMHGSPLSILLGTLSGILTGEGGISLDVGADLSLGVGADAYGDMGGSGFYNPYDTGTASGAVPPYRF